MQIYPLSPDLEQSDVVVAAPVDPGQPLPTPRTFTVVYRQQSDGPLWKVDVVADDAIAAATAVVYSQSLSQDRILGVIDRATLR